MNKIETTNTVIIEEMKKVNTYEDYKAIEEKYSVDDAFAAFVKVKMNNEDWITFILDNFLYDTYADFISNCLEK